MAGASEVTVLYFAAARERAGLSREQVALPASGMSVGELMAELTKRHPMLGGLRSHLRVAVNRAFVSDDARVSAGAEVALIPPVAGGAGLFQLVERPLVVADVVAAVEGKGQGAVVTFSGAVRDRTRGKKVVRLEYEAYVPMARDTLAAIGEQVAHHWPGTELAIQHRLGALVPGDLAVVIAAAAPHRKEAFLACELAIEELKKDAPIWKRECFEDGEVWVGLGP